MDEVTHLEALVENARLDYKRAYDNLDPRSEESFKIYWELLRDYNSVSSEDARKRLYASRDLAASTTEVDEEVLLQVISDEWKEEGLMPEYFAQRVREMSGEAAISLDDFWQLVAVDNYLATKWVSALSPAEAVQKINEVLLQKSFVHEMATPDVVASREVQAPTSGDESATSKESKAARRDPYAELTAQMVEQLERGVVPWAKPWATTGGKLPKNMDSENYYRGANALVLGMSAMAHGYSSQYWATYKQIEALGGTVSKGQHGTQIRKWVTTEKEKKAGEVEIVRKRGFMKFYTVFNYQQTSGLPEEMFAAKEDELRPHHDLIAEAEAAKERYLNDRGPRLEHGFDQAYFNSAEDFVAMPNVDSFDTPENYYAALFHEFTHSTGHKSRLDRHGIEGGHQFGSEPYAKEELVAEMGSAFSMAALGLEQDNTLPLSVAYLENWIGALKNDKTLIFDAATAAQKAVEHMGLQLEQEIVCKKEVAPEIEVDTVRLDDSERVIEDERSGTVPTIVQPQSLNDLTGEVNDLRRLVTLKEIKNPKDFARELLLDEICKHRHVENQILEAGGDSAQVSATIADLKADLSGLSVNNSLTVSRLIREAEVKHADDAILLAEREAQLDAYKEELYQEAFAEPHPWVAELDQYGVVEHDDILRIQEIRRNRRITDWNEPLGDEIAPEQDEEFQKVIRRIGSRSVEPSMTIGH